MDPIPVLTSEAWFESGELNAGAGVGDWGLRFRAWGDAMRVLLALLLVGSAGCGGESSVPGGGAGPTPEGVGRSELDGYIVQRGPGTIVQFNIPPKR